MGKIKKGDLVRMPTHATGLVGIVVDIHPRSPQIAHPQIGIHWFGGQCNKVEWEPEAWVEVVSESR
jgi:hypothetical protein